MNAVRFFSLMGLIALAAWMDAKQGAAEEPQTSDQIQDRPMPDSLNTPRATPATWD